jgi:hypothetical protein
MRRLILVLALSVVPVVAQAEWKKVTRQESKVLLAAPLLENGRELYEYAGWSAQGGHESSYAAIVPTKGAYPRMQVYLRRMSSLHYWKYGSDLDEKWLMQTFPFFKDKTITITAAAPMSGPYLRAVRFAVDRTNCAAFELRRTGDIGAIMAEEDRISISGLYCPPPGTPLSDELLQQATEGVYVRTDSGVQRALKGVARPVPASLM